MTGSYKSKKLNFFIEYVVIAFYVSLLAIILYKHEPWFDEGQAWLLARDLSVKDLFFKYLRYEGSPGLWHLILTLPAKLHMPYYTISIISGLIAAAGVFVFVKFSPFPVHVKILLPFSYFIFYQYAVVARSYVLLPLLLFLTATLYKRRKSKIFCFVLLMCLLANANLHGMIISIAIMFINFIELILDWSGIERRSKITYVISYLLYGAVIGVNMFVLWPASDLLVGGGFNMSIRHFFYISIITLSDAMVTDLLYAKTTYPMILESIIKVFLLFGYSALLLWFKLRRTLLLYMMSAAGLLLLFSVKYVNLWHEGTLFLLVIFVLWLSIDSENVYGNERMQFVLKRIVSIFTVIVLMVQVYWSYKASVNDFRYNYSASRDTADYIKEKGIDKKRVYAVSFHSISILPYFEKNIFDNYNDKENPSFWFWSTSNKMVNETAVTAANKKPDYIVVGVKWSDLDDAVLDLYGYRVEMVFDGNIYWKGRVYEKDAFIIYKRK